MTDLLAATAALVDIPSVSLDERALTDHIAAVLGTRAAHLVVDRVGDNLVARTMLGRPYRLILAGHTDTVPINGNWPSRTEGNTLWGCGTSDMKAGLAVMLELACAVPNPAIDVTYVFYAAEEIAEAHNGLGHLYRDRPDLLAGDVALLGEPTDGMIEAGCQGTVRVQITLVGRRAHTARPWMGSNAIHRLATLLGRLSAYEAREPFVDGCQYREAMQAVKVEGGVAGNVVPDRVVLTVNHRFAPDRTLEQAVAHIRETLVNDGIEGDTFEVVDASPAARPGLGHPILSTLINRSGLPVRAKLGWTDVARFSAHGVPATNFGPGDATLAHTAEERVEREPIESVYRSLHTLLVEGVPTACEGP